ncbi:uncharacterized protein LOC117315838 [Pecten maximus]|uniref:uncharacterized protein LOC117315838 n=1 Tax=Pecten maximus TaxID=6579 RepID=UPI001458222D|nr:uncharacterized protein LOC117315838 [Pecten maximus]
MENVSNLKAIKELEEMYSIIEQCFLGSKLGYTYDQYPIVFDYIRKTRQRTLEATIHELVILIKKHLGRTNIGHVLDAACGSGDVAFHLPSEFGSNVKIHGCDISVKAIEEAQASAFLAKGYENLSYSTQNLLALPGSWDKKFDVVLLFDVLHDMGNRDEALKNAIRVLKDDGLLVIVDPKVSSNILENGNNPQAAIALLYSILWCIPTACCSDAHGVGWGFENKDKLMTKHRLQVVDRRELMGSPFDFAYFAKKILK